MTEQSEDSFLPRGLDHEALKESSEVSNISLHLLGGVGSKDGGARAYTKAHFGDATAEAKPKSIQQAEEKARLLEEARLAEAKLQGDTAPDLHLEHVNELERIYNNFMAPYSERIGRSIAKREREETGVEEPSLIYGEVTYMSIGLVLQVSERSE